jgi:hypothetical protein
MFCSGKRIFERFKLKQDWSPVVFATAPWTGRVQVPPAKLSKEALHIANYVSSALIPREKTIATDKEFQEICGSSAVGLGLAEGDAGERACILALKGPLFSETQQETMRTMVKSFHKSTMSIVSVESKVRWLSVESSSIMSKKFTMRLYAIRNGTHYMPLAGPPTPEKALQFVEESINVSVLFLHLLFLFYSLKSSFTFYVCFE